jgi:hypothetical protein
MNNNLKMKFGFDVGVMVGWLWSQNTTTTVFLVRPQRHSVYSDRSLKWELVVESLIG